MSPLTLGGDSKEGGVLDDRASAASLLGLLVPSSVESGGGGGAGGMQQQPPRRRSSFQSNASVDLGFSSPAAEEVCVEWGGLGEGRGRGYKMTSMLRNKSDLPPIWG